MNNIADVFMGEWIYRSFINDADINTEFNKLKFGAGTLVFFNSNQQIIEGNLGGEGWLLKIKGYLSFGDPFSIRMQGAGEIDGEQWVYDYHGFLSPMWPNGIEQRPSIVGTIVRTVPHSGGRAKAGYVASWVAVKK